MSNFAKSTNILNLTLSFQPTTTKATVSAPTVPASVPAILVSNAPSQPVIFYANQVCVSVLPSMELNVVQVIPQKE